MTARVETPSGKQAGDENFPVGSWLLPARLRPHIARFYAYARAIDDIADNPQLQPDEKICRLDGFEAAIRSPNAAGPGFEKAQAIRASMDETGIDPQHCIDLIRAFKQDAVKHRYADWSELMDYCMYSAAPVGRYLIDLHGEQKAAYPASDALCNALQVLNHLQDCHDDYKTLDRVYLPQDWLAREGVGVEDLDSPLASSGLRRVIDRCLDATDQLLDTARTLVPRLAGNRFAVEAASIVRIAESLSKALRHRDPLAERVVLRRPQYVGCILGGVRDAFRR